MLPDADAELRRLRVELAACRQELNQYRERLPDMITRQITLKGRSELSSNVDNQKVASALGSETFCAYVRSFVFNESPDPRGCAWMMIKFGTTSEERLPGMYRAIASFLAQLQRLDDCHRICQTMNFIDEFDGSWSGEPAHRADDIIRRLPEKLLMEAPVAA